MPEISYEGLKVCGVSDQAGAGQLCKWPGPNITWTITALLPGFDLNALKAVYAEAWGQWAAVCGISPRYVESQQQANVLMGVQSIGPGGVLADSGLPCGASMQTQLQQRYDNREAWTAAKNPPQNMIGLLHVATHEIGHAIGISHIATGNLLAPIYTSRIYAPQNGDITEALARYGPPLSQPIPPTPIPPTPLPPNPPTDFVTIKIPRSWVQM